MYMDNLNQSINRIKDVIKMIQEADFSVMDQLPNKNPDQGRWGLESIIMHVIAHFSRFRSFDDSDVDLDSGVFYITDQDGKYELKYEFDVNIISHGSYDPGDYETPPSYEGPEWNSENLKLTISEISDDGSYKVLYSGPDISGFEKMKFPPREDMKNDREARGVDLIYSEFDEKITDLIGDVDYDYPEPDYDDRD